MKRIVLTLAAATICAASQASAAAVARPIPQAFGQVQIVTPPALSIQPQYRQQHSSHDFGRGSGEIQQQQSTTKYRDDRQQDHPSRYLYFDPIYSIDYFDYPFCRQGLFGRITNKPCRQRKYRSRGLFGRY